MLQIIILYIYALLQNNVVIKKKVNENARNAAKTMWMMDCVKLYDCIMWIQPWQNEGQRSVNNCRSYKSGNLKLFHSLLYIIQVLAYSMGKTITTTSLPHVENECQQSINDCWSCVLGNHTADRLLSGIKQFLAALIGKTDCNTLPALLWKWASTDCARILIMRPGQSHLR
jgi:hypothetical protein